MTKMSALESYKQMLESVNGCNKIKYMPYRVAVKLVVLQKCTNLDKVSLYTINGVYEQHKGKDLNLIDKVMLEDIISDIFFAVQKEYPILNFDGEIATKILVQLLGQIFSKYTKKQINLKSALTVMACLSCDRLRIRLGYIFQLNCNNNELSLTKDSFRNLLRDLSLLLSFLSENNVFESSSIDNVIDNCFDNVNNPSSINEDQFMRWFMTEPPVLEWLQIFYRIKMAEDVNHEVNCKICKQPVKGLRYFCLKCVNYNQCQNCFLIGAINKKHKLKHAMQEYCWTETPQQLYGQYLKSYLGRIFGLTSKMRYLSVDMPSETTEPNQNTLWAKESSSILMDTSTVQSPRQELQSVISQIERENKLLEIKVKSLKRGDTQVEAFLNQHRNKIERQVSRLKHLKKHFSGTFGRGKMKRMQSTPLIVSKSNRKEIAVNMSPIFSVASVESCCEVTDTPTLGLGALSTLYGDKIENIDRTEPNEFSCWLAPKISKNHLDDSTIVKQVPQIPSPNMADSAESNKENAAVDFGVETTKSNKETVTTIESNADKFVLSDIVLNRRSPNTVSVVSVNSKQSSSVWLNASREYAKEPVPEDDKEMEELHTELDKILDQLQKLVT